MLDSKMTINILTTDGPQYDYLIHKLESNYNIGIVIREKGKYQREKLLRQKKYKRYFYNRYQNLFKKVFGFSKLRRKYFSFRGPIKSKIVDVKSINSNETKQLIKKNICALYVVMGTSILSQQTIEICSVPIINIHGGYLPYYRGNNCVFFAYYNSDFNKIANTIHFVDCGIDTGNIIKIVKPHIEANDNPEILYCKAKKMAVDELVILIDYFIKNGYLQSIPQNKDIGHTYKTEDRTPLTDIKCFLKRF